MARTAPAPNIPPIPGMCPGVALLGGGGDGGGGSGTGAKSGKGKKKAGTRKGKNAAKGGQKKGKSGKGKCGGQKSCSGPHPENKGKTQKGDPVDVVTGRTFTEPSLILFLNGPLPLSIDRVYSSEVRHRDVGLGFGWSHSFAWEIEVRRRSIHLFSDDGTATEFASLEDGETALGPDGWVLARKGDYYSLDTNDGLYRDFAAPKGASRCPLIGVRDRYDNEITLEYERERLVRVIDCVGREVRVASNDDGRITEFFVANASVHAQRMCFSSFRYDAAGDLVSATDADGNVFRYEYSHHLLTAHVAPTGLTFQFRYDGEGRCVETWGEYPGALDRSLATSVPARLADNETPAKGIYHCKLQYFPDGYSEVVTSTSVERYFGNAFGRLDKAVTGAGVFTSEYDENGHLVGMTDPRGATTRWRRDVRGHELQCIDPLGRTTNIERDEEGNIRRVVDPAGGLTTVETLPGQLVFTDAIGSLFVVKFDSRGLTEETVAPNGGVTRFRYDAHGNMVEKTDASGAKTELAYDYWGRLRSVREASGAVTSWAYTDGGELLSTVAPDGGITRYEYDGAGNLVARIDPAGFTTHYTYGGLNKLCEVRRPNGETMSFRYDREGRLIEVRDGRGAVHSIELSAAGLVLSERTFDGRVLHYAYDEVGNRILLTNGAGEAIRFSYNLAGELEQREFHDGAVDTFTYDALGNIATATSADAHIAFEYNAVGWLTTQTKVVDDQSFRIDLQYDSMGNIVRRTTSLGHSVDWQRDVLGQRVRVVLDGSAEVRLERDASGREIHRYLPNGGRIDTAYDEMDRMVSRRASRGSRGNGRADEPQWVSGLAPDTTVDERYRYSANSELVEAWDLRRGHRRFDYDAMGQLVAAIAEKTGTTGYHYDEAGNLFERGGDERVYAPGNRLIRKGDTEYLWDDDARLQASVTSDGEVERTTRYQWSSSGLLQAVERADGSTVEFGYDCFARRVRKRLSVTTAEGRVRVSTTHFVWDGSTLVHEIRRTAEENGDPVIEEKTYCFEDGWSAPWAHRDAREGNGARVQSEWFHYLVDEIGTPTRLLTGDGEVACEVNVDTWGKAACDGSTSTAIRFRGQYEDEETGLSYNRHRYYDPSCGRYISADPIGIYGGFNGFNYADNAPTVAVDPDGLNVETSIENAGPRDDAGKETTKKQYDGTSGSGPQWAGPRQKQPPNYDPAIGVARQNAMTHQKGANCAEMDALHKMATDIRREGNEARRKEAEAQGKKYKPMSRADVRREIRNRMRAGAKVNTVTGKGGKSMAPCKCCAQTFRELGVHPDNINKEKNKKGEIVDTAEPAKGGVMYNGKPWDGKTIQQGPKTTAQSAPETAASCTPPFTGT